MSSMFIYVVVSVEANKEWNQDQEVFTDYDKALAFAKEEYESGDYEYVFMKTFESQEDGKYVETTSVRLSVD